MMKRNSTLVIAFLTISFFFSSKESFANFGANGIHDPSSIIKLNGVYHIWGTGNQIAHLTSTDLVNWTTAPTVFAAGTWPSWINTYVTEFAGNFWAPECININGTYYLYYSCSAGNRPSAIGVASSTDLVNWTDLGMVVYSDNSSIYGSIDPAVFADANNKYWMVFGSHLTGIWITQIDPATGKRLGTDLTNIAGSSNSEHEAAFVAYENGFYYLFYNVGICCALTNSTYNVQMGRSANPAGPYFDKSGVALLSGGGATALGTSGKYIGPGHFGLFKENGRNYLTMHYYDGTSNGYPRLDVASLKFGNDGWPIVTRDLFPNGRYKITNKNSGLVWEASGCTGMAGQQLIQNTPDAAAICQQWDLTSVGDGFYRFKNAKTFGAEQVVDIPYCNTNNGTLLGTFDWLNNDCQKFKVEQLADGTYVFSTVGNANRVIEVPFASAAPGVQLGLFDFNGCTCQQWTLTAINSIASPVALPADNISTNSFTAKWETVPDATGYKLDVSANPNFTTASATTIAGWNFTLANTTSTSIAANTGKIVVSVGTAPATYSGTAQASGWDNGNGSKYWEASNISTAGYYSLKISSKQRSNAAGPKNFKLQYKIAVSGVYTDIPGTNVTTADNYTNGALINVALPAECDNQASVYFRWISTSDKSVNNGNVTAAGLSNIDDIVIIGFNTPGNSFIAGYNNLDVSGTSQTVTGLSASGGYFYRVRAVKSSVTSVNSNVIGVTTTGAVDNGIHDPSGIVKEGSNYWMYGTGYGNGDGSIVPFTISYSTDLFKWTRGTKPVFPAGTWPAWINTVVPNFAGIFWAPEIMFINGKYHLYYSASAFGSPTSVIGLATSPTLDQSSPDYGWTDQGVVVSSSSSANVNAIDPAILKDTDGKLWLSYGSFSAGIAVVELDPLTGLKKTGAATTVIAGGNGSAWEAPFIVKEGSYYYLFVNRQYCCALLNSTYYVVTGRSTSITGPYVDKNGSSLLTNSSSNVVGTTVLESSGKFVGPGHFGLLRDNGRNLVSMHYYDATSNGYPRVDIANLKFSDDGWPIITRDVLPEGRYKITNRNSNLVWESSGCTGAGGQQLVQNTPDENALCQQWDLTPVGDGYYRLKNANGGVNTQVADVPFCDVNNKLATWDWLNNDCQKFKIDQLANGSYVFSPYVNGGVVIEVPFASAAPNTQLGLFSFNENPAQQWSIDSIPNTPVAINADNVTATGFKAQWNVVPNATGYKVDVYTASSTAAVPATTIASWNFSSGNTSSAGITPNTGKTVVSAGTNAATYSGTAQASGWNSGNGTKYWEAAGISTKGYHTLKVSSKQRSDANGPRHFKLQYRIGTSGAYADVPGTYTTTADNYTSGQLINVQLPSICENQPSVYLRWLMITNTNVGNNTNASAGTVSSSGLSNIDDIVITGINSPSYTFVTGYEDIAVNGTFLNVTGLTPNIDYYYRVRSVVAGVTSSNSNEITVKTACETIQPNESINQISCNGADNAAITLAASGGSGPYSYSWTGPGTFVSTESYISNLKPGNYVVAITQQNGCISDFTYKITEPALLTASATGGTILCNGGTTTVTVSATGGTAPYNGTGTFTRPAGTYNFIVTDANGCTAISSAVITEPSPLVATLSNSNPQLYFGYSGDQTSTIKVIPAGGAGPYKISITMNRPLKCNYINEAGDENWIAGANTSFSANISCPAYPDLAALNPVSTANIITSGGFYSVNITLMTDAEFTATVTDANGCVATYTTHIEAEDVRCFGENSISKITICHQTGNSKNPCEKICVDESSINEHLAHGDYMGNCTPNCNPTTAQRSANAEMPDAITGTYGLNVKVMPNPSTTEFNLLVESSNKEAIEIIVTDILGHKVYHIRESTGRVYTFGSRFASGAYFVQVLQGKDIQTLKIIKAN